MGGFDAMRDFGEIMRKSSSVPRTGIADGLKMANEALGGHLDERRLRESGLRGEGRLLATRPLGPAPNGAPRAELDVEVHVSGHPAYTITMVRLVDPSTAAAVFPGGRAPVLVDPNDFNMVVIDHPGMAAQAAEMVAMGQASAQRAAQAASQSPADRLERLAGLRDRGLLTEDEFAAQKDRILKEL